MGKNYISSSAKGKLVYIFQEVPWGNLLHISSTAMDFLLFLHISSSAMRIFGNFEQCPGKFLHISCNDMGRMFSYFRTVP